MEKHRKMPRQGCSIPCQLIINNSTIEGFVADISANGLSFSPKDGEFPDFISSNSDIKVKIDMEDFSDIGGYIEFDSLLRWKRGLLIGLEMVSVDKSNFKRWWYLIYKLFFPSK